MCSLSNGKLTNGTGVDICLEAVESLQNKEGIQSPEPFLLEGSGPENSAFENRQNSPAGTGSNSSTASPKVKNPPKSRDARKTNLTTIQIHKTRAIRRKGRICPEEHLVPLEKVPLLV